MRFNLCQSDKGSEFLNSTFQSLLRKWGIKFYTSENSQIKASVVERFNKTLRNKMHRYFTAKHTNRYLDVLPDLLHSYNNTYHRSIGTTPASVTSENENAIRKRLYPPQKPKKFRWQFEVGDRVRIAMNRRPFRRGYEGNWSEEIFVVNDRFPTVPPTYSIVDLQGESIKGKFYGPEMQYVEKQADELYDIEKVLKTRRKNGKVQYFVKWRGYPSKFNSWVDAVTTL